MSIARSPFIEHSNRALQVQRLTEIMRRHVAAADERFTDDQFIREVFNRYRRERGQPLIDPNE